MLIVKIKEYLWFVCNGLFEIRKAGCKTQMHEISAKSSFLYVTKIIVIQCFIHLPTFIIYYLIVYTD